MKSLVASSLVGNTPSLKKNL